VKKAITENRIRIRLTDYLQPFNINNCERGHLHFTREKDGTTSMHFNFSLQSSRHGGELSNPLQNQVDELAGDCFAKLTKARNHEHF
jgi:hypothetical protein